MCRNLISLAALTFVAGFISSSASAQTLFNQNFNSSSTLANYIDAENPSTGQFNAITSVANNTASINSGALVFTKINGSSAGFSRSTDFSPVPSALLLQFDLTISGNTTEQVNSTGILLQLGSGFSSTTVGVEDTGKVHSRIALNWTTNNGEWSIRQGGVGTSPSTVSANTTGTQTVRLYVNNSGLMLNYFGIDNNSYSLVNDAYDLWIGSSRVPNLTGVEITNHEIALTDLKFTYASGAANATIAFDNLTITAIPEPASFAFLTALATATTMTIRRRNHVRRRTS